jgi:hypothetical protein
MAAEIPNPATPSEADCLAWVEGEPLPREREQALARAFGADPALARRLEAMRADRGALCSLETPAAPANLMAGVETALQPMLERQMLLGLQEGSSISDLPPISIVRPVRRSIVAAFFADRTGRRLAAAAAVLVVVGGAAYLGTTYLSRRTAPKPNMIALGGPSKPGPSASDEGAALALNPTQKRESQPAEAPPPPAPVETLAAETHEEKSKDLTPEGASGEAPETQVADAAQFGQWAEGPFLPELDGARAAELAKQGRLLIRVTALDPSFRNGGVAERIRRADGNMIRLGEDAPPALVQLLAPPAPAPEMGPQPEMERPAALASDSSLPSVPAPPSGSERSWTPPSEQTVYLAQVRLDGAALEALRGTLSGGYGAAQYEELNEPLTEGTAALNPTAVVWWTQPPAGWKDWAGVPIVVDVHR